MRLVSSLLVSVSIATSMDTSIVMGMDNEPTRWEWTPREEKKLRKIMKEVEEANDIFRIKDKSWNIETVGSARLAAEIRLYLEILEADILERLDVARRFSELPTIKVFNSAKEFQKVATLKTGAAYVYEAVVDPAGKSRHRIRILENRIFTFVEGVEEPTLNDLDLPMLRAEAAKAMMVGVLGRPEVSIWLERGVSSYYMNHDLHYPAKTAAVQHREDSPVLTEVREHLKKNPTWMPSLDTLSHLRDYNWDGKQLTPDVSNDSWAETLVDFLITEKRGRSQREEVIESAIKVALRGPGTASLTPKQIKALEPLWHKHVMKILEEEN